MELTICGYTPEDEQLAGKIITHIRRETAQKYTYLENFKPCVFCVCVPVYYTI